MSRASAIVVLAVGAATLAGCADLVASRAVGSLKDHAPGPQTLGAGRAKVEISTVERGGTEVSLVDRARAEQMARCGQRHVEYGHGMLKETAEQKLAFDAQCAELHRHDYVP